MFPVRWSVRTSSSSAAIKALRDAGCPLPKALASQAAGGTKLGPGPHCHSHVLGWTRRSCLGAWGDVESTLSRPGQQVLHLVALPLHHWVIEAESQAQPAPAVVRLRPPNGLPRKRGNGSLIGLLESSEVGSRHRRRPALRRCSIRLRPASQGARRRGATLQRQWDRLGDQQLRKPTLGAWLTTSSFMSAGTRSTDSFNSGRRCDMPNAIHRARDASTRPATARGHFDSRLRGGGLARKAGQLVTHDAAREPRPRSLQPSRTKAQQRRCSAGRLTSALEYSGFGPLEQAPTPVSPHEHKSANEAGKRAHSQSLRSGYVGAVK